MRNYLLHPIAWIRNLDRSSAANRYIVFIAIMGLTNGLLGFGEVILRKSLNASGLSVTALVASIPIASLTSIWWVRLIEGRDQRRLLMLMGAVGCLALLTGGWLSWTAHLLIIHIVYNIAYALIGPAESRVLQQHIASNKTGRTYGRAVSVNVGMAALISAGAGYWLEHYKFGYRHVYLAAGLCALGGIGLLATVRTANTREKPIYSFRQVVINPLQDVVKLLRERPDYLRFEAAFMLYGIAFMMCLPVVPLYLVDDLKLGYHTIGLARGMVTQLAMMVAIPLFCHWFDRSTPHRMGVGVFSALSLYPLLLMSIVHFSGAWRTILLYLAFIHFGFTMSGLVVLWQLSSIRFARGEDAGVYQSVHVAATGLRGMLAPLLGYVIMTYFGKMTALACSAVVFLIAGLAMGFMRWIDIRRGENKPLRAG